MWWKTLRRRSWHGSGVHLGLRQNSGVWSASQVEVKTVGKPGSSLLVIENGTEKAKLGRKDFQLDQAASDGAEMIRMLWLLLPIPVLAGRGHRVSAH